MKIDKFWLVLSIIFFVIGCIVPFLFSNVQTCSTVPLRPTPFIFTVLFPLLFFTISALTFLLSVIDFEGEKKDGTGKL
jgi:hypothetical protein